MMRTPRDTDRSAANVVGAAAKTNGTWWLMLAGIAGVVAGGLWAGCILTENSLHCDQERPNCPSGYTCHVATNSCRLTEGDAGPDIIDATPLPDAPTCSGNEARCGEFPETPVCEQTSGLCVQCVEDDDCSLSGEPRIEGTHCFTDGARKNTCGCITNEDCELSDICHPSGVCVPPDNVIFVNNTRGMAPPCGAKSMPCDTLRGGIDLAAEIEVGDEAHEGERWVVVEAGTQVYGEVITFNGEDINLLGKNRPIIQHGNLNTPGLQVIGQSDIRIEGFQILNHLGASGHGVQCGNRNAASLHLVDVNIDGNAGIGVLAEEGCSLTLERSRIIDNNSGGIKIENASFILANNVIAENGSTSSQFGGVQLLGGASGSIAFNTIVRNEMPDNGIDSGGVTCRQSQTTESAVGNIVAQNVPLSLQVVGARCAWTYSAIAQTAVPQGTGNTADDCAAGLNDYHLSMTSPCVDKVPAADTTVSVDIDAQPRPNVAGGQADIGADEFQPPN